MSDEARREEAGARARAHVTIAGHVQGVYFRDATRQEARRAGVTGWVRNLPHGQVEALFEGDQEAVRALIAWCHIGPPDAHVDWVSVTWDDPTGQYDRFTIAPTPHNTHH